MQIYPAIKAKMGDWNYYIVRMKMKEIANEIKFAHDIYQDNTLNNAIQRTLDEGRVKKQIVSYLANSKDRFFSSIVVASLGGNPTWLPVVMDTTVVPEILANSRSMKDSFGVLSFDEDPRYYALDGQHRVAAIKSLVNSDQEPDVTPPLEFDKDLVTVIVILREEHGELNDNDWLQRYRRLFSSLNRYAKPTDRDTNIIMDEDDLIAILTRRLITDHDFYLAPSEQKELFKVKTKGKNLQEKDTYFTTLQTLYAMNQILLTTKERSPTGKTQWIDKQARPLEEEIEEYYMELSNYWDAILGVIPVLRNPPSSMRVTKQENAIDKEGENHFLFRPIGQELFAKLVRDVLNKAFSDKGCGNVDQMIDALRPIAEVPWDLHYIPWKNLVLIQSNTGRWLIRNEERKQVLDFSYRLLRWYLNIDELDEDQTIDLRNDWMRFLYADFGNDEFDDMWNDFWRMRMILLKDLQ